MLTISWEREVSSFFQLLGRKLCRLGCPWLPERERDNHSSLLLQIVNKTKQSFYKICAWTNICLIRFSEIWTLLVLALRRPFPFPEFSGSGKASAPFESSCNQFWKHLDWYYWGWRLSTVGLLVQTRLDQLLVLLKILFMWYQHCITKLWQMPKLRLHRKRKCQHD